jgi:D-alanyl-D-alanine carboxypeptidase
MAKITRDLAVTSAHTATRKLLRRVTVLGLTSAVVVQCGSAPTPPPSTSSSTSRPAVAVTSTPPTAAAVQPVTAAELGPSWHPGCPIDPGQLRRVEVDYLGFDGRTHRGALIVHQELAAEVVAIFDELLRMQYPIERVRPADAYPGADDELSMEDNNTSAYNCRDIPDTGRWSQHAFGRAIDLNPLLNPEIDSAGAVQPKNAGPYVDRTRSDPGVLHPNDAAVRAFTQRGWRWGGDWHTPVDYQHFER